MPMILESNQNHATAKNTEVVNAIPASMGMGGGYIPMVVEPIGADLFNQTTTGTVSMTMSNRATDAHYIPCVIEPTVYSFIPRESQKTRSIGFAPNIAPTLNADGNCAVIEPITFRDDITIKIDVNGVGYTLSDRDYKGVQCVVTENAESNRNT